jgi:hypothetical protein
MYPRNVINMYVCRKASVKNGKIEVKDKDGWQE